MRTDGVLASSPPPCDTLGLAGAAPHRRCGGHPAWYGPAHALGFVDLAVGGPGRPGSARDVAVAAEQAGWDGVFVWDHLWNRTSAPFADPFVTLAAIAAATERVLIGTMVTALPRRRPQLVAQATTSLDRLSGGRMVLGLGLGVDSYGEYSVFDEPAVDDRARAAALDAGIELLQQMLAGGPVAGAGGRVTTAAGVQQPRVPMWVAGRAALSAGPRRVRRHGLEGLALVDADAWTPDHVTAALRAGDLTAGELDVALVGGTHPDPEALAAAGVDMVLPGDSARSHGGRRGGDGRDAAGLTAAADERERRDGTERVTGIEPAFSAWEADVLPLNYTRIDDGSPSKSGDRLARGRRSFTLKIGCSTPASTDRCDAPFH